MSQSLPFLRRAASSLAEVIDLQIRENGPMSIATYMGLALTYPRGGYYTAADGQTAAAHQAGRNPLSH